MQVTCGAFVRVFPGRRGGGGEKGKRGQSPRTEIMKILRGHRASHSLKSNCANCSAITEYGRANSGIRARIQRARTPCAFFSVRPRQKITAAAWFSYIQPPVHAEIYGAPLSYKELPPFFCPHSRRSSFCFNTNFQGARKRKMGNVSLEWQPKERPTGSLSLMLTRYSVTNVPLFLCSFFSRCFFLGNVVPQVQGWDCDFAC